MDTLRKAFDEALKSKSSGHLAVCLVVYAALSTWAVWGDVAALGETTKIAWATGAGLLTASIDATLTKYIGTDGTD